MDVDPAASVRIWAIEITLGGRTFDVPALPASHWLPVLLDGNPLLVLDLIESLPEEGDVDELILSGQLSTEDLVGVLIAAIEQAAGRSFHAAFVIAQVARTRWDLVSGLLSERGFRWDQAPLGAALDAVYSIVIERLNPEGAKKFQALLDNPAATGGRRRPADATKALGDFEAIAGPKPAVGVRSTGGPSDSARSRTRQRSRLANAP